MDSPPLHWTIPSGVSLQRPTYDEARTTRWARGRAEQRRQRGEAWLDDCGHGCNPDIADDNTQVASELPQPRIEPMSVLEQTLEQPLPNSEMWMYASAARRQGWRHEAFTDDFVVDGGGGRVGAGGRRGAAKPGAVVQGNEESEESWSGWWKQLQYTLMPWTALDYNCVRTLHGWYRCG
jgi:hypothetical protein